MPRHNDKGAILIVSLWILIILSMLAITLGHRLSAEIKLTRNRLNKQKAFYAAKAGVKDAVNKRLKYIDSGNVIYADSFNQPWLGNENFSDEQANININKASLEALTEFLRYKGVDDETSANLAESVVNYRDKNLRFDTASEILLAEGMTEDIFYDIIRDITVYGSGAVNINTASRVVLSAVLTEELADYILSTRKWFQDSGEGVWFVAIASDDSAGQAYILHNSASVRNILSDNPELGVAYQQKLISVVSSVFRVKSGSIEAIVRFKENGDFEFLYWNQDSKYVI